MHLAADSQEVSYVSSVEGVRFSQLSSKNCSTQNAPGIYHCDELEELGNLAVSMHLIFRRYN
jgi:hypothetical protein